MVRSAALTIMNLLENDPQLQAGDIQSQNYHIELDPLNILGPSKNTGPRTTWVLYQVMAPHSPEYLVSQWGVCRSSFPIQYLEICRSRWS